MLLSHCSSIIPIVQSLYFWWISRGIHLTSDPTWEVFLSDSIFLIIIFSLSITKYRSDSDEFETFARDLFIGLFKCGNEGIIHQSINLIKSIDRKIKYYIVSAKKNNVRRSFSVPWALFISPSLSSLCQSAVFVLIPFSSSLCFLARDCFFAHTWNAFILLPAIEKCIIHFNYSYSSFNTLRNHSPVTLLEANSPFIFVCSFLFIELLLGVCVCVIVEKFLVHSSKLPYSAINIWAS